MLVSSSRATALAFACLVSIPSLSYRLELSRQGPCSIDQCRMPVAELLCDMEECNRLLNPAFLQEIRDNVTLAEDELHSGGSCKNAETCLTAEAKMSCTREDCAGFFKLCRPAQCQSFWQGGFEWCATRKCAPPAMPVEKPVVKRDTCASVVKGAKDYSPSGPLNYHKYGDCKCPKPMELFPIDCREDPVGWGDPKHFYKAAYRGRSYNYEGIEGFVRKFEKESQEKFRSDPNFFICYCAKSEQDFDEQVWKDVRLEGSVWAHEREKYERSRQYIDFVLGERNQYIWRWHLKASQLLPKRIRDFQAALIADKDYKAKARKQKEFEQKDAEDAHRADVGCTPISTYKVHGDAKAASVLGCLRRDRQNKYPVGESLMPKQLKTEEPRLPFSVVLHWSGSSSCLAANADGAAMAAQTLDVELHILPDIETHLSLVETEAALTITSESVNSRIGRGLGGSTHLISVGDVWSKDAVVQFLGPYEVRIHMYFPIKRLVRTSGGALFTRDMIWIELAIHAAGHTQTDKTAKAALYYRREGDATFSQGYFMEVEYM